MKPGQLQKLYALVLLVIFGGIVIHAPLSVGMGTLFPGADLLIKSWKEILLLFAMPLGAWLAWRQDKWRELISSRIIQVSLLYIALHIITAAGILAGPLATMAGLAIDLRYVIFFMLVYILIKVAPAYGRIFIKVGAVGATVIVGFGVLQLFLPADILSHIGYGEHTIQPYLTVDKNPDYIRINSTLRGPNPLGAYIVIILGLIAAYIARGKVGLRRPKIAGVAGVTILSSLLVLWASYSRSAAGAAALAVVIVAAVAGRHMISRRIWIAGCVVIFALIGGLIAGRESSFVEHVILHKNSEGGSEVGSNEEHLASLQHGTERMLQQPIGAGIGSTGSASLLSESPLIIENQYLFIAHEVGWLGLLLFLVLFFLILQRLWRQRRDWLSLGVLASGVGLGLIGILLPVWADDTVSIVWWGLAAAAIASGGKHATKQAK